MTQRATVNRESRCQLQGHKRIERMAVIPLPVARVAFSHEDATHKKASRLKSSGQMASTPFQLDAQQRVDASHPQTTPQVRPVGGVCTRGRVIVVPISVCSATLRQYASASARVLNNMFKRLQGAAGSCVSKLRGLPTALVPKLQPQGLMTYAAHVLTHFHASCLSFVHFAVLV